MLDLLSTRRAETRAWALAAASSALYFLSGNEADNDLWINLLSGLRILAEHAVPRVDDLSYTATGSPWIDHEWLSQMLMAGVFERFGTRGLLALKIAIGLATAALLAWPLRGKRLHPAAVGFAMILVFAVLGRGFAIRPQVFTYLGVAWLLARLDGRRRADYSFGEVLLFAVVLLSWANAHGAVLVGIGILGLHLLDPRSGPGVRSRATLMPILLVIPMATPYGSQMVGYVWHELTMLHPLTEWGPVHFLDPAARPFLLMMGLLLVTLPFSRWWRSAPWRAAALLVLGWMAFRHQRHTPVVALLAAGPLALGLDGLLRRLGSDPRFRLSTPARAIIVASLVLLSLFQMASVMHRLARDRGKVVYVAADYPVGSVRWLRGAGASGNLALPLDWGAYALWHAPELRVSIDGRFAMVYSSEIVDTVFALYLQEDESKARRLLDDYPTDFLLVRTGRPVPVRQDPGWQRCHADHVAELFARGRCPAGPPVDVPTGLLPFP